MRAMTMPKTSDCRWLFRGFMALDLQVIVCMGAEDLRVFEE
jgi:hypothetical protein